MVKVVNFLKVWGILTISVLLFFKTCSITSKVEKLSKETKEELVKLDSTVKSETISEEEFKKMITIEGLKSEKRMIQSTDRKILDVNRQSEIDKEIENLEK